MKMCISTKFDRICKMQNRNNVVGGAITATLTQARADNRLICGLLPAIAYLEKNPEGVLLCLVPETRPGDAATHMQTVLLQAFCYENFIPVIQVDSGQRLADLCGIKWDRKSIPAVCRCAIVTRGGDENVAEESPPLSPTEQQLADFYECTLDEFPRPVVQLPV